MNLIPTIREALGLEVNERFQLLESDGTPHDLDYRFADNNELQYFNSDRDCWESSSLIMLGKIVYGNITVKKFPFKPKEGKIYYYVGFYTGEVNSTVYTKHHPIDIVNMNSGNCYRTYEEAKKHVDEWMEKLYGKDWREVVE